jgi:hypothetical protein
VSTIEQELADVLRAARLGPKQARAVSRRLGWDGLPPATLAAAGAAEGYTRERVRQLEQRARQEAEGRRLPCTEAALDVIEAAAPSARGDLARALVDAGIAARPFDPAGVLSAGELIGLGTGVLVRDSLVVHRRDANIGSAALVTARRLVARHGAACVDEVARVLRVRSTVVRRLLTAHDEATWLDRDWLVLPVSRSRATTGLRKMLAVARSLTFPDIEDGLRRPGCDVELPRATLRGLCESLDWVSVEGQHVTASVDLDADKVLSPLERKLFRIFQLEGPVLEFTPAVRFAEAQGISTASAAIYLGKTPVLQTLRRGLYALRGFQEPAVVARAA